MPNDHPPTDATDAGQPAAEQAGGAEPVDGRADSPLLDGLTEPQRQAVCHVDGPLLVLAGPGSGKTRVITHRIAYLIREVGIAPWNVLAITFTNKAAGEMRHRLSGYLTARQSRAAMVCTFHAMCARLLREFAPQFGLTANFSIYDSADQKRLMRQVLERLEMDSRNFPPAQMLATISQAKNELVGPEAFATRGADFMTKRVAKVYAGYQKGLRQSQALDFDDLLFYTAKLLREDAEVLATLQQRFNYILIDEYQDTNKAQFIIASALAGEHRNLCATGDPDQSIYGWRGADIRNILQFEEQFPETTVVRLEENFRSTGHILSTADALIRHNTQRRAKTLWTQQQTGTPVRIVRHEDGYSEAQWIAERFRELHLEQGTPWAQMAIFYRTNSLSRVVEDAMREAAIPYQIVRGTAFYERKEIKDAVAYLRLIANPDDEVNLRRIVNTPARGISDRTIKALDAFAISRGLTLIGAMRSAAEVTTLNTRAVNSIGRFLERVDAWRREAGFDESATAKPGASDSDSLLRGFVERIIRESGLEELYRNDSADPDEERLMNLGELVSSAQQFEAEFLDETVNEAQRPDLRRRLEGFLERIALVSDLDTMDESAGAVTLMTLHAAKGLEYDVVAVVSVEEGMLPHNRALEAGDEGIEEERRLLFVAMTRARRELMLSYAGSRNLFGRDEASLPSSFLAELPEDDSLEQIDLVARSGSRGGRRRERRPKGGGDLRPGMMVRHPHFGIGQVLLASRDRVKVSFNDAGVKTLVPEHARLSPV